MEKHVIVLAALIFGAAVGNGIYSYSSTPKDAVTIGYLANDHHSAALTLARVEGMFKSEEIDVKFVEFTVGSDIMEAMAAGQIDIGFVGTAPAIMAIDKGMPIKIVAAVNEEGSGIEVRKNSSIKSVDDLVGKSIVMPSKGSMQDILLNYLLVKEGINATKINIMELDTSLMPNALQAGKVDAFIAWEPFVSSAKLGGYGDVLMYSTDIWKDHPCCVVVARNDFRKDHPDKLRKILKIQVEATDDVNENKNLTASILSKEYDMDINVVKESLNHIKFVAVPTDDFIANVLKIISIQRQLGYVKRNLTEDDIFDLQYLPKF